MSFTVQQEDEILNSFISSDEKVIVRDGVLDPSVYWTQKRRVLFVLKEANDPTQQWAGDYRDPDCQGVFQRRSTWPMVSKIAALLTEGTDLSLAYDDANALSKDKDSRLEVLRRVALINLKKSAGGATCNISTLKNI